jgi:Ca-activated chloride channel homolog
MKRLLAVFACVILTLGYAQTYVQLVLDASGSMWNKLDDGMYRITAAKDVLGNFIKGLPTGDLNVGLRVYGATMSAMDEGSCDDIQLVMPMEGVNKPGLQTAVDEAKAKGATPIVKALELAAADFPAEATKRLIVLVTDGEESCGGDLNAIAEQLKSQGIEIDLKIIGFALDEKAQQSFQGIGEFVNAADAEQLAGALETAVEEVVVEESTPAERQAVTLTVPATASAGQAVDVKYEGADLQEADTVTMVPVGTEDKENGNYVYINLETKSSRLNAPFEAGDYEVRYVDTTGSVLARAPIKLEESEITMRVVGDEIRAGSTFQVAWTGPNGEYDLITIVPEGTPDDAYETSYSYTSSGNPLELTASLEVGKYELRYTTGRNGEEGKVFARVPVEVLEAVPVFLQAPKEIPGGSTFEVEWAGPNNNYDKIMLVALGTQESENEGIDYTFTDSGNPATLTAPLEAGDYEIRYIGYGSSPNEAKLLGSFPIKVIAVTATIEAPSEIIGGSNFEVTWSGSTGDSDIVNIVPVGASDNEDGSSYTYVEGEDPPVTLTAPLEAGDYEVRLVNNLEDKVLATFPVKVIATNATVEAVSKAMAGSLVEIAWSGSTGESDIITVVPVSAAEDENGEDYRYIDGETSPLNIQTSFEAGDYEVRLMNDAEGKVTARAPLKLTPPNITLSAPSEVTAGSTEFEVNFTGPNAEGFIVAIVPVGASGDEDGNSYTYGEGPNGSVTLYSPDTPGNYELRYKTPGDEKVLFSLPITVK